MKTALMTMILVLALPHLAHAKVHRNVRGKIAKKAIARRQKVVVVRRDEPKAIGSTGTRVPAQINFNGLIDKSHPRVHRLSRRHSLKKHKVIKLASEKSKSDPMTLQLVMRSKRAAAE